MSACAIAHYIALHTIYIRSYDLAKRSAIKIETKRYIAYNQSQHLVQCNNHTNNNTNNNVRFSQLIYSLGINFDIDHTSCNIEAHEPWLESFQFLGCCCLCCCCSSSSSISSWLAHVRCGTDRFSTRTYFATKSNTRF